MQGIQLSMKIQTEKAHLKKKPTELIGVKSKRKRTEWTMKQTNSTEGNIQNSGKHGQSAATEIPEFWTVAKAAQQMALDRPTGLAVETNLLGHFLPTVWSPVCLALP